MTTTQLQDFEQRLYKELNKKYAAWSQNAYIQQNGFALFYTPLRFKPDLMIIGYNPGKEDKWDIQKHQKAPSKHDYFNNETNSKDDYVLANKMRTLFSEDLEPSLRTSIKLNQLFFKSSDIATWNKEIEADLRQEIEAYCLRTTFEIIDTLQPKIILAEGYGTFNRIIYGQKTADLSVTEHYVNQDGKWKKIILESAIYSQQSSSRRIIGISHPSGSRVSNKTWEEVRKKLGSFLL